MAGQRSMNCLIYFSIHFRLKGYFLLLQLYLIVSSDFFWCSNFTCSMTRLQGFRMIKFSLVENPSWLNIAKPVKSIFSSPGRSPGRAIVLPPALALAAASTLAKSITLQFFM